MKYVVVYLVRAGDHGYLFHPKETHSKEPKETALLRKIFCGFVRIIWDYFMEIMFLPQVSLHRWLGKVFYFAPGEGDEPENKVALECRL